jgi:hypothetical protein
MILLMLRDGSLAEVPQATDVIHRQQTLNCIDATGQVLTRFDAREVLAYTCSEVAARRLAAEEEELRQDHLEPANIEVRSDSGENGTHRGHRGH